MTRKQPPKERPNQREDRDAARPRRSGEGSASALANLKSIERDRARIVPLDDEAPRRPRR